MFKLSTGGIGTFFGFSMGAEKGWMFWVFGVFWIFEIIGMIFLIEIHL